MSRPVDYQTTELSLFEGENHACGMFVKRLPFFTQKSPTTSTTMLVTLISLTYQRKWVARPFMTQLARLTASKKVRVYRIRDVKMLNQAWCHSLKYFNNRTCKSGAIPPVRYPNKTLIKKGYCRVLYIYLFIYSFIWNFTTFGIMQMIESIEDGSLRMLKVNTTWDGEAW